jgi:NhaP-type Na+/H+ or K+/H+ antiporter
MAVGGAAYLVAQAVKQANVVAFDDLGMEAIYEFSIEDMLGVLTGFLGFMFITFYDITEGGRFLPC